MKRKGNSHGVKPAPEHSKNAGIAAKYVDTPPLILFFIFLCLITTIKIFIDNDVFWHLATGKYIVEHKSIPSSDIFGFKTAGVRWIPFEWGWDVISYLMYIAGGYVSMSVFRSIMIISIFVMAFLLIRKKDVPVWIFVLLGVILCFGEIGRLSLRPHVVSYFFVTLVIFILVRCKSMPGKNSGSLYWIVPLFLVWANMHMGVALGIGVLTVFAVSESVEYLVGKNSATKNRETYNLSGLKKIYLILILSSAALLVNPFFYDTYIYALSLTQMDTLDSLSEWRSPFDSAFAGFYYVKIYIFFLAGGVLILYYSYKERNIFYALLYLVFGAYSTQALRYTSDYMVIIFIPFTIALGYALSALTKNLRATSTALRIGVSGLMCAVLIYLIINVYDNNIYKGALKNKFRETGFGVNEKFYPAELIQFVKRENINSIGSKPFNNLRIGGYIIWELPGTMNFIDSRDLNNDVLTDYLSIERRKEGFEQKLNQYGVDYVIYSIPELTDRPAEIGKDLIAYFSTSPDWKLIFWDDKSFLFVKNEAKFSDVIQKYEYKYITPLNYIYNKKALQAAFLGDKKVLLNELRRKKIEETDGVFTNSFLKMFKLTGQNF